MLLLKRVIPCFMTFFYKLAEVWVYSIPVFVFVEWYLPGFVSHVMPFFVVIFLPLLFLALEVMVKKVYDNL